MSEVKQKNHKLALIIPTKGRVEELDTLLDSLKAQDTKPHQIIILDAGEYALEDEINIHSLPVKYVHTGPNSLTEARNMGVRYLSKDCSLAGFLDDDVILCKDAIKKMVDYWDKASCSVAGVAFNVVNSRRSRKFWFFKKLFFLGDNMPGNVLVSGYQTMLDNLSRDFFTKWLPGGATVWRKEVFEHFKFDERYKGYGCMEDTDFSYRVSKKYKLISLKDAQLIHKPHAINEKEQFQLGYFEIINRYYFISKFEEFSKVLFFWASLGRLLENFFLGIVNTGSGHLKKAYGNLLGLKCLIVNRDRL